MGLAPSLEEDTDPSALRKGNVRTQPEGRQQQKDILMGEQGLPAP